jgi:hypothetical protein
MIKDILPTIVVGQRWLNKTPISGKQNRAEIITGDSKPPYRKGSEHET